MPDPSIVRQSPLQQDHNTGSGSFTFESDDFGEGNAIGVLVSYYHAGNHTLNVYVGETQTEGDKATLIGGTGVANFIETRLYLFPDWSGASRTVSLTSSGTSWIDWSVIEIADLATSDIVEIVTAVNVTTNPTPAVSNATGTLSQGSAIAFALTSNNSSASGTPWAINSPWSVTSLNVKNWSASSSGAAAYRVLSSTDSITAQWNNTSDFGRCIVIVLNGADAGSDPTGTITESTEEAEEAIGGTASAVGTVAESSLAATDSVVAEVSVGAGVAEASQAPAESMAAGAAVAGTLAESPSQAQEAVTASTQAVAGLIAESSPEATEAIIGGSGEAVEGSIGESSLAAVDSVAAVVGVAATVAESGQVPAEAIGGAPSVSATLGEATQVPQDSITGSTEISGSLSEIVAEAAEQISDAQQSDIETPPERTIVVRMHRRTITVEDSERGIDVEGSSREIKARALTREIAA